MIVPAAAAVAASKQARVSFLSAIRRLIRITSQMATGANAINGAIGIIGAKTARIINSGIATELL